MAGEYSLLVKGFLTEIKQAKGSKAKIEEALNSARTALINPVGTVTEETVINLYLGGGQESDAGLLFLCGDFEGIIKKDVKKFASIALSILYSLLRLPSQPFGEVLFR